MGRRVLSRFEVVEYQDGSVIEIQSIEGSFPIRVRRTVEPLAADRCRVVADIGGEPGGFFKLAAPLLKRLAQRSVDADYDRLKALLES